MRNASGMMSLLVLVVTFILVGLTGDVALKTLDSDNYLAAWIAFPLAATFLFFGGWSSLSLAQTALEQRHRNNIMRRVRQR